VTAPNVDFGDFALWLTTEDGIRTTNRICLEPEVYHALTEYVARLTERAARPHTDRHQEEE
jgi:hypothetical protein